MEVSVETLRLGSVRLPATHPRASDHTSLIQGYAVKHPDGVIVFDTGAADDHPVINELYAPSVVPIVDALAGAGVDERDVVAIVNSHLHFDHCGQNRFLPSAAVWVQRAEHDLVDAPLFTVPDWARISHDRLRLVDGDEQLVDGVRIVATPGHTPGHQSLVVEVGPSGPIVIGGQCCYTCGEYDRGEIAVTDAHDDNWVSVGRESIAKLRRLRPSRVHFSHDIKIWRPT